MVRDGKLVFRPQPVQQLEELSLPLQFRGSQVEVELRPDSVRVGAWPGALNAALRVQVGDAVSEIEAGESHTFTRRAGRARAGARRSPVAG
jgi:trehalose/maltose hydrolase-like predicted phosphorylase